MRGANPTAMLPTRRSTTVFALTLVTSVLAPNTGSAQFEIAPQIGAYIPVGSVLNQPPSSSYPGGLVKRPEGDPLVGVRALYWFTKRLGVAATMIFTPNFAAVTDSLGTTDVSGGTLLTDLRLIVPLTLKKMWSLYVGAGPAVISRSGSAWAYYSGQVSPAFVGCVGVRIPVYGLNVRKPYPPPRLAFAMELSDYFSRAHFDQGLPTETTPRSHQDVTFSFVFTLFLHRS